MISTDKQFHAHSLPTDKKCCMSPFTNGAALSWPKEELVRQTVPNSASDAFRFLRVLLCLPHMFDVLVAITSYQKMMHVANGPIILVGTPHSGR